MSEYKRLKITVSLKEMAREVLARKPCAAGRVRFCAIGHVLHEIGADVDFLLESEASVVEEIVDELLSKGQDHVVRELRERGMIDEQNMDTKVTRLCYSASDDGEWERVRWLMEAFNIEFVVSEDAPPVL